MLQTSRAWTIAVALLPLSLHSSEPFRILPGNVPKYVENTGEPGNEARLPAIGHILVTERRLYLFTRTDSPDLRPVPKGKGRE